MSSDDILLSWAKRIIADIKGCSLVFVVQFNAGVSERLARSEVRRMIKDPGLDSAFTLSRLLRACLQSCHNDKQTTEMRCTCK